MTLPIDRHLRVVALLESLAAGLHDLALRIGDPLLCAFGSGSRPGASSLRCNSPGNSSPRTILAPTLVFFGVHHPRLRQAAPRSPPASEPPLCPSAHRLIVLALARVSRRPPSSRRPRTNSSSELRQMSASELTYRAMLRDSCSRPRASETLHPPPEPRHRAQKRVNVPLRRHRSADPHRRLVVCVASTPP